MPRCFLLAIMIVLLVGCGERKEAAQVLGGFLEAIHLGQYEQAYGMLAADDQKEISEYAYVVKLSKRDKDIRNPSPAKTSFSIKGIKRAQGDKGRMIANVRLEMPDIAAVQAMALQLFMMDPNRERIDEQMATILDGGAYPTAKVKRTYYLVKEGEQWKVLINLKAGGSLW